MHSSEESYNSLPKGYAKGRTKYIIITGSVISGIGKGVVSAGIARLLELAGLNVMPFKFDGYLNLNAGTLNPFRHGEVFVLDDGTECDMDLGTYERFMGRNLTSDNYLTAGMLFELILEKERQGGYLGRDVQFIPHVTGEIKKLLRERALRNKADVLIIEVGGTIGDIENSYFIEAMRELIAEEGKSNVLVVNVTYVLEPEVLGEQKSKAAQQGIKHLMSLGLNPDIIICRSTKPITDKIKQKISVASNINVEKVLSMPDLKTVYQSPLQLFSEGVHKILGRSINFKSKIDIAEWKAFVNKLLNPKAKVKVMIAGKYTRVSDSYVSILEALKHAGAANNTKVDYELIETTGLNKAQAKELISKFDGLIVPGGFGSRGVEGKINAISAARELKKPFLGLCYGMQLAVIEYGRSVCGLKAHTTEIEPETNDPVIFLLPEQVRLKYLSGTMRLGSHQTKLKQGSVARGLYGSDLISERFRHRYEVNPDYVKRLEDKGLVFSGESSDGLVKQVIELPGHPFFIASQFHPELTSKPLKPNPLFKGFVKACLESK